jgi:hypothetical protein
MSRTGSNFNKSLSRLQGGGDAGSFTELSPKSRYDKTSKMINLVKKNRQYKREQFEHQKRNYQQ